MLNTLSVKISLNRQPFATSSLARRSARSLCLYRNRWALHSRTPSMMLAWFSSSLRTASCSPSSGSNSPPLASKHEMYRMLSPVPKNRAIWASACLWMSCVPQMNRTLDRP